MPKLITITVTDAQWTELRSLIGTPEYYERLGDITEHNPAWLREQFQGAIIPTLEPVGRDGIESRCLLITSRARAENRTGVVFLKGDQRGSGLLTESEV